MEYKSNMNKFIIGSLMPVALLSVTTNSIAGPLTDPYLIHTYVTGDQSRPSVTMGTSGDHTILFRDSSRGSVFARQYHANGAAVYSTELPAGIPNIVSSATDGNGNYVLLSIANDGSGNGVFATVYNKLGNIIVTQLRVNSMVTGTQSPADVAMNRNGDFVVTWTDMNTAGTPGVYAKKFNLSGTPLTSDILVSNPVPSTSYQAAMAVAMDESAGFAITYLISYQSTSNSSDVWARQYDAMGNPVTNPFRVNTTTPGLQDGSDIAMDAYGNYMVTWESYSDGDGQGVYAQRYDTNGYKIGGEFLVNSSPTDMQRYSSVAMAADGSSVVTWTQWNTANPGSTSIYARELDENGTPRGDQFLVSSPTTTENFWPKASIDACGYYIVAWESKNANNDKDIYARRYASSNPSAAPCLANGKTASNLAGTAGGWKYFKISVPAGKSLIDIQQWGPSFGDADLYVRYGALPTLTQYHFRPYLIGNNERVTYANLPAGDWYIGIYGYDSFSSVNLNAQYY